MDEFDDKKDQLTAKDVAKDFGLVVPQEKKMPNFSEMTKEQIEEWEQKEVESSDIYRIAARVKNSARNGGRSLTPVGEQMCNLYVHVLKSIYDFADTLEENKKEELRALLRQHERFPGKLISLTSKR